MPCFAVTLLHENKTNFLLQISLIQLKPEDKQLLGR